MKITPYIFFNGNCEEAVSFYHSILGGELDIIRYDQMPKDDSISLSENWINKIMHCSLSFKEGYAIYFSDSWEGSPVEKGTNTAIHINVDSEQQVYDVFNKLSEGGNISMPAEKTFWGSVYGAFDVQNYYHSIVDIGSIKSYTIKFLLISKLQFSRIGRIK